MNPYFPPIFQEPPRCGLPFVRCQAVHKPSRPECSAALMEWSDHRTEEKP